MTTGECQLLPDYFQGETAMSMIFKYVTGNEAPGPLRILSRDVVDEEENEIYEDLMVGTDCENPYILGPSANWHFRVENVPSSYIGTIIPRQLDGPVPETYGTWFHAEYEACREDCGCNQLNNWPLYFTETDNGDGTHRWDIFVVPYLGGSTIAGVDPKLPLQDKAYTLKLFNTVEEEYLTTLTSETIPELSPIFGDEPNPELDSDFYPALFGYQYREVVEEEPELEIHSGVDIVPLGLFSGGPPDADWDLENNDVFKKVYAVVGGSVQIDEIEPSVYDITIYTTDQDPLYPDLQFIYSHIVPKSGLGSSVQAGDEIGTILNHQLDSRSHGQTHLHFEVKKRGNIEPGQLQDPRQYIYPGLTQT